MKRQTLMMALLFAVSAGIKAQSVTYNHDESVQNQVTIQETGAGSFTPDLYYDAFHKSYRNWAPEQNKLSFRTLTVAAMKLQEPYAEKIDSNLTKRMRVEAENLLDREVDAAWLVEKGKVNSALSTFREHVESITLNGGSYKTYEDWKETYDMVVFGIQCIQDGYMPNSEREQQYMQAYKDVRAKDVKLVKLLSLLKSSHHHYWSSHMLQRKENVVRNSGLNSLTRWKDAAVQAMQRK